MNKDEEMIEEMAIIISGSTELDTMNYYRARYKAKDLYNANYRKVADDEIVIKKKQYEQLKKYNRDRKRLRLKWQQAKQDLDDIYSNGFVLLVEHHEIVDQVARETRQETAREILALIGKPNYKGDDWYEGAFYKQEQIREQIAENYGIELE